MELLILNICTRRWIQDEDIQKGGLFSGEEDTTVSPYVLMKVEKAVLASRA